jgi:lipid-A-disaccharide synthase-like uncharacterized protein
MASVYLLNEDTTNCPCVEVSYNCSLENKVVPPLTLWVFGLLKAFLTKGYATRYGCAPKVVLERTKGKMAYLHALIIFIPLHKPFDKPLECFS